MPRLSRRGKFSGARSAGALASVVALNKIWGGIVVFECV